MGPRRRRGARGTAPSAPALDKESEFPRSLRVASHCESRDFLILVGLAAKISLSPNTALGDENAMFVTEGYGPVRGGPNGQRVRDGACVCDGESSRGAGGERAQLGSR